MIYVGIDDTDVLGSLGTKRLARLLIQSLWPAYSGLVAVRHQLLFDRRVPYTSKNSSVSLLFEPPQGHSVDELTDALRCALRERFVEGSDPGLCVTERVPESITQFGKRCQRDLVDQAEARRLAAEHGIHLEGLGGTEDGVIGALAAVGLAAEGSDGRVVQIAQWPDDLSGPQDAGAIRARDIQIRSADTGEPIEQGVIDVGKHLRPNYRDHRVVLFVERAAPSGPDAADWRAIRLT